MTPTPQRSRLLIAVERAELYERFHLANSPFDAQHCLPEELAAKVRNEPTDAVLVIEPRLRDGFPAAIREWRLSRPDLQVLFVFRKLPENTALVDLMRSGAFDVRETEIEAIDDSFAQQVMGDLKRRLDEMRISGVENEQAHDALESLGLIGESVEMQSLFVQILQASRQSESVMICGERGSGKRLIAHAIHALGSLRQKQITAVDCASLSTTLLRVSIFGSGSQRSCISSGTMLLNDVTEMPRLVQADLQKAFDSGNCSARMISTATERIDPLVGGSGFPRRLFTRLSGLLIEVPPLRRRLLDVPLLSRYFLSHLESDQRPIRIADEAATALNRYHWPGNVRELKTAIAFAAGNATNDKIELAHLPETVRHSDRTPIDEQRFTSNELDLANLERQAILRALQIAEFDKTKAARLLGIGKTTLYRKLKEVSGQK